MPPSSSSSPERIYLDHAATTPVSDAARAAMMDGLARWANPSSPHGEGRAARAALEEARRRIAAALGWDGHVIFTSGASEAIAIGVGRSKVDRVAVSPVEHDAVLRAAKEARRLDVDADGRVTAVEPGALNVIQHVNNETGVIQPIGDLAARLRQDGGLLFCDCAQSAGKIALPLAADMIAISACKFGGAPGAGALLVRDLTLLHPGGGQEQGYRGGTENLPAVLAMAAALEDSRDWMAQAARLRLLLDEAIRAGGGEIVAEGAERLPTIASYRMPGQAARAQLIRFDMAGIAVSAGAACSSGTLKTSPVLKAMGWDDKAADEVVRVSVGRSTTQAQVQRFIGQWRAIAGVEQAA
ncbi:MAG: cysteine desulfurase family protein [Sphingobium sp.]